MRVALVNPNTVIDPGDPFTTGIPYMPVGLATAAAALRRAGHEVSVVDAFGDDPFQVRRDGRWWVQGLRPEEAAERVEAGVDFIFLYAGTLAAHHATTRLLAELKRARRGATLAVLENTQAVTAYSVAELAAEFRALGADHVVAGEAEQGALSLLRGAPPPEEPADPDGLPHPAWDLFPLRNYWRLRYAHGPMSGPYLPVLTSRGCPYPCRFCVVPRTNALRWRPRSPRNVVDELEALQRNHAVDEFHVEDLNFAISEERVRGLCRELLSRGLKLRWKLCAGTKTEPIRRLDTLDLMARAGCRYLSFSPESGSARVLEAVGKPFDREHALALVGRMRELGIRSQACFVLGFPGEEDADRAATWAYARRLVRRGLDEIALFIVTPVPGSAIFKELGGYSELSELTFSPRWRADFGRLSRFRLRLYAAFLLWKLLAQPLRLARQPWLFLSRRFETKMEMAPYRALAVALLRLRGRLSELKNRLAARSP